MDVSDDRFNDSVVASKFVCRNRVHALIATATTIAAANKQYQIQFSSQQPIDEFNGEKEEAKNFHRPFGDGRDEINMSRPYNMPFPWLMGTEPVASAIAGRNVIKMITWI